MPSRTDVLLCWLLFAAAMAVLSWLLHAIVPPVMTSLQGAIGVAPLGILMLVGWVAGALYVYPPLLRRWRARRRQSRIRQG